MIAKVMKKGDYYQTAKCLAEQGLFGQRDILTTPPNKRGQKLHQQQQQEDDSVRFHKTRMCLFHQKGACIKGGTCSYAHDERELKASPNLIKTRLCQDWLNGRCTTDHCKFAHGRKELRFTHDYYKTKLCFFWQQGGCTKGEQCRHAHGENELRPLSSSSTSVSSECGTEDHRTAAVLEALRLAEQARELVARSTELLTLSDNAARKSVCSSTTTATAPTAGRASLVSADMSPGVSPTFADESYCPSPYDCHRNESLSSPPPLLPPPPPPPQYNDDDGAEEEIKQLITQLLSSVDLS